MTKKKIAARLGRMLRMATGISFPVAMRLGRLAVQVGGRSAHLAYLSRVVPEARAILGTEGRITVRYEGPCPELMELEIAAISGPTGRMDCGALFSRP